MYVPITGMNCVDLSLDFSRFPIQSIDNQTIICTRYYSL